MGTGILFLFEQAQADCFKNERADGVVISHSTLLYCQNTENTACMGNVQSSQPAPTHAIAMKSQLPTLLLLLLLTLPACASAGTITDPAEQPPRMYMQVQYLEVKHGPLLNEILSQTLLPFQQRRVDEGSIVSWALYETLITGPDDRYRMVSITKTLHYGELFKEFSAAENYRNLGGSVARQSMLSFHEAIEVQYSEIWVMEGDALAEGASVAEGKYITKNYLDSRGRSGEHRSLELDFWRPVHHQRIEAGILNAWAMYTLSKPGGSSRRYTYSTIDYYGALEDVAGFDSREMARRAHPGLSEDELSGYFNRTGPSRTAWKTELWRRILTTE